MRRLLLDRYVIDALMPDLVGHDQVPSAFLVYLCLWRRSIGERSRRVALSLRQLAKETGLSKRAVQDALRHLVKRRLVGAERAHATAVPAYEVLRPWRRGAVR